MLKKTATRLLLCWIASLLPCAATQALAQVPEGMGVSESEESATSAQEAESERIADPELAAATAAAKSAMHTSDARNEQVKANYDAVREVLESEADASGVGDVLREARLRAPQLDTLDVSMRERERLLAGARLDKVRMLEAKRNATDPLEQKKLTKRLSDQETYIKALHASLLSARELHTNATVLIEYLDGHLLWLRSADPIGADWFKDVTQGALWLAHPQTWKDAGLAAYERAVDHIFVGSLALLVLLSLLLVRTRLRKALPELASEVGRVSTDSFLLTLRALIFTLLLSLPIPILLIGASALLAAQDHSQTVRAISSGLYSSGSVLLLLDFARQLCRKSGLAEVHFRWNDRARRVLQRNLRWLILVEVAAAFLVASCDASGTEAYRLGVGRLAFIAGSSGLSFFMLLTFHPSHGVVSELLAKDGLAWRFRRLWYGLLVLAPFVLAIAAALGFYYTATEVQSRFFTTGLVVLTAVVVYSMLERWLLVARRRIAVKQARQRLAQAREARAKREEGEEHDGTSTGDAVPELDLQTIDVTAVSNQTMALVRTLVVLGTLMLLWAVWRQVLPALAVLDGVELTKPTLAPTGEVLVQALTLWSLLAALLTVLLTLVAARNLPSMLEFAILARFHVDSGARYAAATLTRYAVIAIGVLLVSKFLGVDWSKAQWIIAALGVGLGFGLQEIVANFVSGLIILFERPIRVGDTVTVGQDSGTVSRLQIRATTITDWDNKEILVPNKNFITESVINWTLTSNVTRVIAKVGVAYGTDVQRARDAITEAVKSVPAVLDTPASSVFFLGFGDSSLDFEVRAFVDDLNKRLPTLHELNMAIYASLAAAEIEIPFPQRDLHLRSDDTK
jgi:potassium efflux system protein